MNKMFERVDEIGQQAIIAGDHMDRPTVAFVPGTMIPIKVNDRQEEVWMGSRWPKERPYYFDPYGPQRLTYREK